jgi:hypothetical protein
MRRAQNAGAHRAHHEIRQAVEKLPDTNNCPPKMRAASTKPSGTDGFVEASRSRAFRDGEGTPRFFVGTKVPTFEIAISTRLSSDYDTTRRRESNHFAIARGIMEYGGPGKREAVHPHHLEGFVSCRRIGIADARRI